MAEITISELLRGCTPGHIQSVGYMQVIPLISDMTDDRLVSPQGAKVKTTNYGTLVFENKNKTKVMVVPAQTAYIVAKAAQDHALPHVGLVKGQKTFGTARCVQQSQPGLIGSNDEHRMAVLPFSIREAAHNTRKSTSYGELWPAIQKLNQEAGVGYSGNLVEFFNKFKQELEQFVAEFEPVPDQIGAIILIGGKVVGIERSPNYEYWTSIWPSLIRDCYGSLAVMEAKAHPGKNPPPPRTRVELKDVSALTDLVKAAEEAEQAEYDKVKAVFNNVSDTKLDRESVDGSEGDFSVESLKSKRFVGQIVSDDEKILYGSLIATEKWKQNEDWYLAESFSM